MPQAPSPVSPLIIRSNIHDVAADRIRQMILSGELKSGDWVRMDELAKTLGVSTMPVREALRKLQAEGLVTFHPRRGAMVSQVSADDYEEIYAIRAQLETLACQWAAEDFSRIPIDRLKKLLTQVESAERNRDVPRRLQLVREFFFTIFEASQKEHLLRLLSSLWDLSQQYRRYFSSVTEVIPQRIEHYRQIYHAVETRDADALIRTLTDLHTFIKTNLIPRVREQEELKSK